MTVWADAGQSRSARRAERFDVCPRLGSNVATKVPFPTGRKRCAKINMDSPRGGKFVLLLLASGRQAATNQAEYCLTGWNDAPRR